MNTGGSACLIMINSILSNIHKIEGCKNCYFCYPRYELRSHYLIKELYIIKITNYIFDVWWNYLFNSDSLHWICTSSCDNIVVSGSVEIIMCELFMCVFVIKIIFILWNTCMLHACIYSYFINFFLYFINLILMLIINIKIYLHICIQVRNNIITLMMSIKYMLIVNGHGHRHGITCVCMNIIISFKN